MRGAWRGIAATAVAIVMAAPIHADTLSDVLIAAYRSSPLLEQQRYLLRATDEDVAIAVSALRPAVNFQANYSKTTAETPFIPRTTSTGGSLALVLDYTLVDGGQRYLRIGAAKESVLGARFGLVQFEQNVLLDAITAYFDLRLAVRIVDVRENNVRLIREQLRAAEDRFEVGEVTRTDVAIAQSRLSSSQSALAAARGQVDIALEVFRLTVGRLPVGNLQDPPASPQLPATVGSAQQLALQVHPLISAGQHEIAALTLLADARAADRLPSVNLQGSAGRTRPENDSLRVELQGRVPLYTGGRLPALQRQAIARAQGARADLGQTSRAIVDGVGRAWAGLEVARAQISATREGVRASQLAFEGFREEAQLGARTTLDVLDAEQDLLDARTDQLQAESDAQLAIYNVLAAMGLLTTEHLGLSVERYDPSVYYNVVSNAPQATGTRPSSQGGRLDSVMRRFGRN
ncbi:TolC family outer membrane protein [Jannaschia rubra]|uniref:Outer membrane efflux protein BepC n=1 Tax=Jannaschia rubra TaxID=282197 RepID=A0A0M6XQE1_9RHOB|nr:TolC family outer membrane protein [Jannaschia rubra]CTQ33118.1 Outer membrane efflux protein BepC precursor [Jannaschia rubra]SFG73633.1 outer membrane protein [Jannaschia rubra]